MKQADTFDTSDFHLATALSALGHHLETVDRTNHSRSVFQFSNSGSAEQDAEAFYKDQLSLNPRVVLVHTKLIKDRLHAGR
ncbi:MAG: DUF5659 domain-containing protein [Patescibacteria group bacterium]